MSGSPSSEQRMLHLVKTDSFAGWVCDHCAWKWPLVESKNEADRIRILDVMRQEFAIHDCDKFRVLSLPFAPGSEDFRFSR